MTRPTVDQIAAVLRQAGQVYDVQKWAAEIAALWAEPQSPVSDACPLVSTIHAWRRGQVSSTDMGDAIDARIIALADARIDAKMGAGSSPQCRSSARVCDAHREFVVAVENVLEEITDAGASTPELAVAAIRALHARAEAAEKELAYLRSQLINTEENAIAALVHKHGWARHPHISRNYATDVLVSPITPTGAARD